MHSFQKRRMFEYIVDSTSSCIKHFSQNLN